jgi:hypothetical protein
MKYFSFGLLTISANCHGRERRGKLGAKGITYIGGSSMDASRLISKRSKSF